MNALKEDEEQEWLKLAAMEFFKGYAPLDANYDELPPDAPQALKAEDQE